VLGHFHRTRCYRFLASGGGGYSNVVALYTKLERKAKSIIANPYSNIGEKAKNGPEAQTITNESMTMQEHMILLTHLRQEKNTPINANTKEFC
jgi:hypothetical protein